MPFAGLEDPFYVYRLFRWDGGGKTYIYVGRGQKRRAKTYYQVGRPGGTLKNWITPKTHNRALNAEMARIRSQGGEVGIELVAGVPTLEAARVIEAALIAQYKRIRDGGTLYNVYRRG